MSYVPTSKVRENVEVPTPVFLAYSGTAAAESKVIEYKPCCRLSLFKVIPEICEK